MANYSEIDAPLYTVAECKARIKEIDTTISNISAKPVGVGVPGVGNAHYAGRLSDLRKERDKWGSRLSEAIAYENKASGKTVNSVQGPRQILE